MEREPKRRDVHRRGDFRGPEQYENDDYSRFAGRDYAGNYGTNPFDYRESGTESRPGLSGKSRDGETWTNSREYNEQRRFMGKAPKGYNRSDDRIYEEVCETLMRHQEIDATNIGVKVHEGFVTLEGRVQSRREMRVVEMAIEDLPGVKDVRNELRFIAEDELRGPEGAVRKDLGIGTENKQRREAQEGR